VTKVSSKLAGILSCGVELRLQSKGLPWGGLLIPREANLLSLVQSQILMIDAGIVGCYVDRIPLYQRDDKYRVRTGKFFGSSGSVLKSAGHCIQTYKMTSQKVNKSEPRAIIKSKQIRTQLSQNDRLV